jgi:hypothetical protein
MREVIRTATCMYSLPNTNTRIYHTQTRKRALLPGTHAKRLCTYSSVWSVELWASPAAMCRAPSSPMLLRSMLYTHMYVRRTSVAHDRDVIRSARLYTSMRVCLARIHTLILVHNAIVYTCTNTSYYYALMRKGHVLLLEYFECGVVGKSCPNVPRSFYAYSVPAKAVCTYVC